MITTRRNFVKLVGGAAVAAGAGLDPGRARATWQRVVREHSGTQAATVALAFLRRPGTARR